MFEGWNQDEIDGIQEVIASLQRFYEQKQVLEADTGTSGADQTYDIHCTADVFHSTKQDTKSSGASIRQKDALLGWKISPYKMPRSDLSKSSKKVEVAVPELAAKQSTFVETDQQGAPI